jgi:N-acetylneuraminic acid mutarotase
MTHPCLPRVEDSRGWREEAPFPTGKRDEGRAVALDGKIYIAGGTTKLIESGKPSPVEGVRELVRARSVDEMLEFDPATRRYRQLAPMPERLNHMAIVAHGGLIYVIGGMGDLLFGADPRDSVFVYDPKTNRWSTRAPMPTPRGAAATGVIGDTVYVAGGMGLNGRILHELEALDLRTGKWRRRASMPTAREHLAGAALDGRFYAFGGRTLTSDAIDVAERYAPATKRWEAIEPLPQRSASFGPPRSTAPS